jgi:dTDP-4-amino-4,6-dideoxygalactose transaminase
MANKLAIDGGKPVRDNFLIFGSPLIEQDEIEEVVDTLRSGWLSTGPKTKRFERRFADYIGSKFAIATNSCSAALHLSLKSAGIGEGDEVITSPITFPATANVVIHVGAKPVFADVRKDTFNIDPAEIKKKITNRTRAIIPVHLAGHPCQMDNVMEIARKKNLIVIEDAAHAIEAFYEKRKIGTIGDMSCFSFYVTKNLCTGEGGMVTTNNSEWARKISILRLHGISKDAWKRYSADGFQPYDTLYPGYKYNMMDIQASLGLHQLKKIEGRLKIRERHARMYDQALANIPEIITPYQMPRIRHAHHLYIIMVKPELLKIDRNQFVEALKAENIGAGIHFTSLHLHSYYKGAYGYKADDFPNAKYISDRIVSLPLSPKLTEEDIRDVIRAVRKIVVHYRR